MANPGIHQDATEMGATLWGNNRPYIGVDESGEWIAINNADYAKTGVSGISHISSGQFATSTYPYLSRIKLRLTTTSLLVGIKY